MKGGKRRSTKRRLRKFASASASASGGRRRRTMRKRQKQRGGYGQYMNNTPFTNNYSVGGILGANNLGLANPPPIKINNAGMNVDNYNHFTGKGFASKNN